VAATSVSNAWAVGSYGNGTAGGTLVEHWNGTAWKVQKSPNAGGASRDLLDAVAATSASNAWAVGSYDTAGRTLVEHWNGTAWKVQKSPSPGGAGDKNFLYGVSATSATSAWAVGYYSHGTTDRTLIEHWNGTAWTVQKSPSPGGAGNDSGLYGVSATSAASAWAVGYYDHGTTDRTLIEHWNGGAWTVQKSPDPGGFSRDNDLHAVAAASAASAWAVGYYGNGTTDRTVIEHWNGTRWTVQKSPDPGGSSHYDDLHGVAAASATSAWAVGSYGSAGWTLIEHRS
jgi:hypothetical protein